MVLLSNRKVEEERSKGMMRGNLRGWEWLIQVV